MKRKRLIIIVLFVMVIGLIIFGLTHLLSSRNEVIDNKPEEVITEGNDVLIAYFSWSGHGQQMARWISEETNGDLFRIVPSESYDDDYQACADRAKDELDNGIRPELSEHINADMMAKYDVIYLVYPVWWYDLPMPVWTFLEEYDFSGKTIIPCFSHNGSSSGANSLNRVSELVPNAKVLTESAFSISGNLVASSEKEIKDFASSIIKEVK